MFGPREITFLGYHILGERATVDRFNKGSAQSKCFRVGGSLSQGLVRGITTI